MAQTRIGPARVPSRDTPEEAVSLLLERGYTAPKFHAVSHPRVAESEAFNRLVAMAALLDQPVMIFHVSTAEGAAAVRRARGDGLKVFAAVYDSGRSSFPSISI